jgi:pyruvate-formate lyase-activating enzyme
MSDETKKFLTEEELVQLKNYKASKNQITFALGENRIQKESLLSAYRSLASQEQDLISQLSIKYGDGSLDLTTGEIISTPSE